jgi:transcriptional regulator with GAF, ATPase, and Fis domain
MALIAFAPSRPALEGDASPFERLAVGLSSCFSTVEADDVDDAVAHALEKIGTTFGVDECTLVAFAERGATTVAGSWALEPGAPCGDQDLASMPWLVQRLTRNAVVATTPASDLPHAATQDRAHAERTGFTARLAVPVAIGARVAYALMLGSRHRHGEWPAPIVERLRLMGEIIGAGLKRIRQEEALRGGQADAVRVADPASGDAVYLQEEARNQTEADQIIGESPTLRIALSRLSQVAPLDATVLLLGETGTGKELFARALHDRSRRRQRTLIRVNCAALPASLIESELFGHERGAFTGAVAMRQGRFELADGGTIFLDEIGDLTPELQAKLLRVLQEGEFERVGSSKTRRVDVRIIAATHVDLEKAVAEGRFRADLYYRLSVFPITLPALRDRRDDIPQLVWFFIHRRQRDLGRRIARVPAAVVQALQAHDWPGNVRELENVIERAMIRSADGTLQLDDPLRADPRRRIETPLCGETLDAVQRSHIERVLRECGGRINGAGNAAIRLGLHPNTLRFRIKKLGVVMPQRRSGAAAITGVVRPG